MIFSDLIYISTKTLKTQVQNINILVVMEQKVKIAKMVN